MPPKPGAGAPAAAAVAATVTTKALKPQKTPAKAAAPAAVAVAVAAKPAFDVSSFYAANAPVGKRKDKGPWAVVRQNSGRATCLAGILLVVIAAAAVLAVEVKPAPSAATGGPAATAQPSPVAVLVARAVISNGSISGTVTFRQLTTGLAAVNISIALTGVSPAPHEHGFHVHQNADLGNACGNAGPHFNPFSSPHGGPTNASAFRHVGDLGNIPVVADGSSTYIFSDSLISLRPADTGYIVGHALVLHAGTDDLGLGLSTGSTCGTGTSPCTSNTTGNAGNRTACAVIVSA